MAEYIKRESIQKALKNVTDDPSCPLFLAAMIEQYIDQEPAADVVEVKHGKWIDREGPDEDLNVTDRCSVCWHSETHSQTVEVPYCWFCGAKMDLEG